MQGSTAPGDAERVARYAERPGFRISELRITLRDPDEQVELHQGQCWGPVRPGRPHLVTNSGGESATFLVLQGIGDWDHIPLPKRNSGKGGRLRVTN